MYYMIDFERKDTDSGHIVHYVGFASRQLQGTGHGPMFRNHKESLQFEILVNRLVVSAGPRWDKLGQCSSKITIIRDIRADSHRGPKRDFILVV